MLMNTMTEHRLRIRRLLAPALLCLAGIIAAGGANCIPPIGVPPGTLSIYNNTTDPTNKNANFAGSAACSTCHSDYAALHAVTGHAHALTRVQGASPSFPSAGAFAGVPNPPNGFAWTDVSYLLGGYTKSALFFGTDGNYLTNGLTGTNTQWGLALPHLGHAAQFFSYLPDAVAPVPFDFDTLRAYVTGAVAQDPANPMFQESRPGFLGTWSEAGVQCEACHGPGSNHIPSFFRRDLFVDISNQQTCKTCHSRPAGTDSLDILASGGFIRPQSQWQELAASGAHASFACTFCHDPHRSIAYDRAAAIRNECIACHTDMNMALHEGKVFTRPSDGYTETLTCMSCHMPFAVTTGPSAAATAVGPLARVGDTRSHIFRITTDSVDFSGFLTPDGSKVKLDASGRAALSVDYVCLRCHNSLALPTLSFSVDRASEIAIGVHREFDTP